MNWRHLLIAWLWRQNPRLWATDLRRIGVYFSQYGEDIIVAALFPRHYVGFYVDVGAHHPVRFSNTALLYRRGWRGINIEPNADVLGLFQRERPRDINLKLVAADGEEA